MQNTIRILIIISFFGVISISLNFPPPPPPAPIGAYLDGVFPNASPSSSWELADPLPGITLNAPLRILPFPNTEDHLVLCKWGEIWRISLADQTQERVLDIKDRCFKKGEGGSVGLVLHPKFGDASFPDKQIAFVFYRTKPDPDSWLEIGFNRLSKFQWDEQNQQFDPDSEEILIQQYDRMTWHNGGAMFFGPDEFLYLTLGDEGDASHQTVSTQRLDGGLFSGIIRIDVDKDPTRSHPIIRQPLPNAAPPAGWGDTYTQGYYIPNDNPWLSPDGSQLEEFYAIGVRSPYAMSFDEETQRIWMTDVGSDKREEINIIEKGDNLQWPFVEGTLESEVHARPNDVIGNEKSVFFEYGGEIGSCIIGGSLYRGNKFPSLNGKFLFADWRTGKLMALTNTSNSADTDVEILLSDLGSQPVDMPSSPAITGIYPIEDGRILIAVMGEDAFAPGKILSLKRKAEVDEPPAKLSELGAFTDLATLNPAPGLIPYRVNAPLWSDRAVKKRWMVIPNDGTFDSEAEQIQFEKLDDWRFPSGTVFVKHFELPKTTDPTGETYRLETRFFIIDKDGNGYGLTYKWNEEGTEAFLLGGGTSNEFDIYENGSVIFTQKWDYPSRDQCLTCHNANANYVLGVKTHQLNGELEYESGTQATNQLAYLNQHNIFRQDIGNPNRYIKSFAIDDESADLETRVRSYLDANCSSCHRSGGVSNISLEFRYQMPLRLQNIINFKTQSQSSNPHNLIVEPEMHQSSELWIRDASLEENRMPPIARNMVDDVYIEVLAEWIDNLPEDAGLFTELLLFPNPTNGWLNLRISDDWEGPYEVIVQNIAGQIIRQERSEAKSIQLDLTDLAKGSYILEVSGTEERSVRKIVLQ